MTTNAKKSKKGHKPASVTKRAVTRSVTPEAESATVLQRDTQTAGSEAETTVIQKDTQRETGRTVRQSITPDDSRTTRKTVTQPPNGTQPQVLEDDSKTEPQPGDTAERDSLTVTPQSNTGEAPCETPDTVTQETRPSEPQERDSATVLLEVNVEGASRSTVLQSLTPEFIAHLEAVVQWWLTRQAPAETGEKRPKFRRGENTRTKTVRLSLSLIEDAEEYAHNHRELTGGTFSGLVELLLFERLGRADKYLEPEKRSKAVAQ